MIMEGTTDSFQVPSRPQPPNRVSDSYSKKPPDRQRPPLASKPAGGLLQFGEHGNKKEPMPSKVSSATVLRPVRETQLGTKANAIPNHPLCPGLVQSGKRSLPAEPIHPNQSSPPVVLQSVRIHPPSCGIVRTAYNNSCTTDTRATTLPYHLNKLTQGLPSGGSICFWETRPNHHNSYTTLCVFSSPTQHLVFSSNLWYNIIKGKQEAAHGNLRGGQCYIREIKRRVRILQKN